MTRFFVSEYGGPAVERKRRVKSRNEQLLFGELDPPLMFNGELIKEFYFMVVSMDEDGLLVDVVDEYTIPLPRGLERVTLHVIEPSKF